ncbi:Uncharacterised protein [Kingella potus]|uniref:Lipoprotein n=1 Tax=Kingella potus TaxID=265175 RepID=A0A377R0S0_9NEIS|nr:hypothetical protein [Kingella potus]UOP01016.1 hypothetical protein LVJ84_01080 [Kingella potus]STR00689.1 Uncharacterised protein [Kingella potus]
MKKFSLALGAALLLAACGGGYEQYEGYWKRQQDNDKARPDVVRIVKEDSKTYLLKEHVLPNRKGEIREKSMVLSQKDDGTLAVDTGFGSIPLILSEDGKTLRAERRAFDKISEGEFGELKQKIEQDQQRCEALKKEYRAEKDANPSPSAGSADWQAWRQKNEEMKEKYKTQRDQISGCDLFIL